MDSTAAIGIALLATGTVAGSVTVFWLRSRVSPIAVIALFAAIGVVLGTGGLLVQDPVPDLTNWSVTVLALSLLTPIHFHLVLGRPRSGATS